jgi:hypothetical protein
MCSVYRAMRSLNLGTVSIFIYYMYFRLIIIADCTREKEIKDDKNDRIRSRRYRIVMMDHVIRCYVYFIQPWYLYLDYFFRVSFLVAVIYVLLNKRYSHLCSNKHRTHTPMHPNKKHNIRRKIFVYGA